MDQDNLNRLREKGEYPEEDRLTLLFAEAM
jgi:hypothetical protein